MPVTDIAPKPPRIRWVAGSDRVAHGQVAARTRTLCGLHPIDERLAWPEQGKCPTCEAIAAIPEGVAVFSLDEFLDEIGARSFPPAYRDELEGIA